MRFGVAGLCFKGNREWVSGFASLLGNLNQHAFLWIRELLGDLGRVRKVRTLRLTVEKQASSVPPQGRDNKSCDSKTQTQKGGTMTQQILRVPCGKPKTYVTAISLLAAVTI